MTEISDDIYLEADYDETFGIERGTVVIGPTEIPWDEFRQYMDAFPDLLEYLEDKVRRQRDEDIVEEEEFERSH